ncbi:hypothetical protein TRVL_00581 [Trypanosoma vivax]|nr:hypothetical protein TRVL_00581 [Trypanosoma vivax]
MQSTCTLTWTHPLVFRRVPMQTPRSVGSGTNVLLTSIAVRFFIYIVLPPRSVTGAPATHSFCHVPFLISCFSGDSHILFKFAATATQDALSHQLRVQPTTLCYSV